MIELVTTIRKFGFPTFIRTDNEQCFTSSLMKWGLNLLVIKHKKSDVACPWQNGRIERFFGTFVAKFKQFDWSKVYPNYLQAELNCFQTWYNHVRIHSNLNNRTPVEFFTYSKPKKKWLLVQIGMVC